MQYSQSANDPSIVHYIAFREDSSSATASNLPGPSRTVGKLFSYLGTKLEKQISLAVDKLGYGPLAYRRKLVKGPYNLRITMENMTEELQKKSVGKLMKYIRCAINYRLAAIGSNLVLNQQSAGTSLTQSQALDLICDMILYDSGSTIRDEFLNAGLHADLNNLQCYCHMAQNQYPYLARRDPDIDILLASSRKALTFVEDHEINTAAKPFLGHGLQELRSHRGRLAFMSAWLHAYTILSRYIFTENKEYVSYLPVLIFFSMFMCTHLQAEPD